MLGTVQRGDTRRMCLGERVWEHTVAIVGGEGVRGTWRETGSLGRAWIEAQGSAHLSSICWAT